MCIRDSSYQGDDIDDEVYYDWHTNFTNNYLRSRVNTPYQFATGTFKIDDMDFSDFLILILISILNMKKIMFIKNHLMDTELMQTIKDIKFFIPL